MAFQFPWTNFHELNLDWFLSKFKQFTNNFLGTTATAESVPYGTQPTVTVTGGELDDDTDIVDPFTFNFKIPAGQPGEQGEQGVPGTPGQDGFSPIATVTKSGSVATITITDVNGTTTTTISDGEVTQAQLDTKAPAILSTASGLIANFSDGADDMPMTSLVADIEPVQDLSNGDPSPTNICPITGHTEVNVTRTGKNLLPFVTGVTNQNGLTSVVNADGSLTVSGTATGTGGYITSGFTNLATTIKDTSITFSTTTNLPGRLRIFWNYNSTDMQSGNNKATIFISSNHPIYKTRLYLFTTANTAYNFTIYPQIELGPSATAYEPYQVGDTYTVDWTAETGTVYGGTIDVATGVLTVTDGYIASYAGETLPSTWISDRDVYASGTTPTTGAEVVYKLTTPQTYQLTLQQLFNTLYGVNNVWSDTGDSTVTYTADTMLYIQNLTQPTEDDMIANTAIANRKFFMIGNNLYRATTAIASGSQIIPGSNATALSLADALNLL